MIVIGNMITRMNLFLTGIILWEPSFIEGVKDGLKENAARFAALKYYEMLYVLDSLGSTMNDILSMNDEGGVISTVNEKLGTVVTDGIGSISSVGVVIALGLWLFNIIELAVQDRLTPETLIKSVARVVIAACLCDAAGTMYKSIKGFGDALQNDIQVYFKGALTEESYDIEKASQAFYKSLCESDSENWISMYVGGVTYMMPIYLTSLVLTVICYLVQLTRVIELSVRAIFLPIAFGMLADDGWKGAGGRYIRKFIAICSQGAVLIAIGELTTGIMSICMSHVISVGSFGDVARGGALCVGVGFACISVMFKSIGIVNDAFGA